MSDIVNAHASDTADYDAYVAAGSGQEPEARPDTDWAGNVATGEARWYRDQFLTVSFDGAFYNYAVFDEEPDIHVRARACGFATTQASARSAAEQAAEDVAAERSAA